MAETWKKRLADILKKEGIIEEKTTGEVTIHLNQGGITKVYVKEEFK